MRSGALAFAFAGTLLTAGLASAAVLPPGPQPTNMLSPTNPVSFCDGSVMPGDPACVPGVITYDAANHVAALDFGSNTCNGSSQFAVNTFPLVPPVTGFGRGGEEMTITAFDNFDPAHPRPIAVHFAENGSTGTGDMTLIDTNGDHVYEQMHIVGSSPGFGPIDGVFDIQPFDGDGDGVPDFASLSNLSMPPFAFGGLSCDVGGNPVNPTNIFVPVAHQPDGNSAIVLDTDGNGIADPDAFWGPVLAAAAPLVPVTTVPTVSELGLVVLALLLLAAGLRLARRSSRPVAG
jgi:hypothetical protein